MAEIFFRTRDEFITSLKNELEKYDVADKDEIIADFERHFADSIADGTSEEEVCKRLGSTSEIAEIAKQYATEDEKLGIGKRSEPKRNETNTSEPNSSNTSNTSSTSGTSFGSDDKGSNVFSARYSDDIKNVEIKMIKAEAKISISPDNDVHVYYRRQYEDISLECFVAGNTLFVKEKYKTFLAFINIISSGKSFLNLMLPEKLYNAIHYSTVSGTTDAVLPDSLALNFNTISGKVDVKAFADKIVVNTTSGNVLIENSTAKEPTDLRLNSVSGVTTINGFSPKHYNLVSVSGGMNVSDLAGTGEVSVTSGKINLKYKRWDGALKLSSVSGKIAVALPPESGANIRFSRVSGSVRYNFGGNVGTISDNTYVEVGGINRQNISISLTSGKVEIDS